MVLVCQVCTHPSRGEIDRLLIRGSTLRDIVGQFPDISKSALHRHKAHIMKDIERAELKGARRVMDEIRGLVDRTGSILDKAESQGDNRTALAAIREMRGCLELLLQVEDLREIERRITVIEQEAGREHR